MAYRCAAVPNIGCNSSISALMVQLVVTAVTATNSKVWSSVSLYYFVPTTCYNQTQLTFDLPLASVVNFTLVCNCPHTPHSTFITQYTILCEKMSQEFFYNNSGLEHEP